MEKKTYKWISLLYTQYCKSTILELKKKKDLLLIPLSCVENLKTFRQGSGWDPVLLQTLRSHLNNSLCSQDEEMKGETYI